MSKKNKPDTRGFVYSTDPNFQFEENKAKSISLTPAQQKLKVLLETKQRAGTGCSVKDGEIIVQGDQRDKVMQWLLKNGYSGTKRMG